MFIFPDKQNVISQILQSHDAELQFDKLYTSGSPATQKVIWTR